MSYLFSFLIFRFCKNAFLILQVKVPVLECRVIITEPVTDAPLFLNVFVDQDFRATTVQGVSLFTLQCKLKNLGVFLFLFFGFCFCCFFWGGVKSVVFIQLICNFWTTLSQGFKTVKTFISIFIILYKRVFLSQNSIIATAGSLDFVKRNWSNWFFVLNQYWHIFK